MTLIIIIKQLATDPKKIIYVLKTTHVYINMLLFHNLDDKYFGGKTQQDVFNTVYT